MSGTYQDLGIKGNFVIQPRLLFDIDLSWEDSKKPETGKILSKHMTIVLLREPGSIWSCEQDKIDSSNSRLPILKLKQMEQVGSAQIIYYIDEKELGYAYSGQHLFNAI